MKRIRRPASQANQIVVTVEEEFIPEESQQDAAFRKLVALDSRDDDHGDDDDDSKRDDHDKTIDKSKKASHIIRVSSSKQRQLRILIRVCLLACMVLVLRSTPRTTDDDDVPMEPAAPTDINSASSRSERHLPSRDLAAEQPSSTREHLQAVATKTTRPTVHPVKTTGKSLRLGSHVPEVLQRSLADYSTPLAKTETPYFWDVHFAGETIAESVFRKCHFLIQACEHGLRQPNYNGDKLEVFEDTNGALYVNVDTTTPGGIQHAQSLQLAKKHLADIVISPRMYDVAGDIFSSTDKARLFALFRHPVHRAIDMYYYLATASWDPMYNPKLKDMTLLEYANSGSVEHNWVTRFLVNKVGGKLDKKDMVTAKEILRTKCLIGLYDDMEASLRRFSQYFGWSKENTSNADECRTAVVQAGDHRHDHPPIQKYGKEWNALVEVNQFDLELYEYARILYRYQGEQIFGETASPV
jgi:hypothetical protein